MAAGRSAAPPDQRRRRVQLRVHHRQLSPRRNGGSPVSNSNPAQARRTGRCARPPGGPRSVPARRSPAAQELAHGDDPARQRRLGQPEVGQVHVIGPVGRPAGLQQHVRGLHVTMNQAVGVRGVQRGRDLGDGVPGPGDRQRPDLVDQRDDVAALNQPHGHEENAVGLAYVIDRNDVRVIDRGGCP